MQNVITVLPNIEEHNGHPSRLEWAVQVLTDDFLRIMNHPWTFQPIDDGGFDFDGLYERHRSQSKLPELFDKLTGILERILASDELDSRKVVASTRGLLRPSLHSGRATWDESKGQPSCSYFLPAVPNINRPPRVRSQVLPRVPAHWMN